MLALLASFLLGTVDDLCLLETARQYILNVHQSFRVINYYVLNFSHSSTSGSSEPAFPPSPSVKSPDACNSERESWVISSPFGVLAMPRQYGKH